MQGERRNERGGRRFNRGRGRQFPPKPVELGKEYDVDVREVSRKGDGVARIQGLVTFIPNAKPGDHIRVKITRIGRRFAEAEIVTPSK
ncbi:MAG: TRAM domain-containing protein [Candidatus Bathyarchaeia archaeon]|nr:TRAM domain-containing protein [Candidatus Bathyarchaeota archaeon]